MSRKIEFDVATFKDGCGGAESGLLDGRRRRSSAAPYQASSGGSPAWRALRGPCRLARLCLLGLVVPALLVSVPLYMRFHVLHEQQYPVALSDVRLLDSRVSTTWCQRQVVSGNASFNAYLVPQTPLYDATPSRVGMTRHLVLQDDMKEYWAFYLLPGSQVHISACSRWPGASLIVIRGHKHLRDCAYIGDDSSEEEDELAQIERERNGEVTDRSESISHRRAPQHPNGSYPDDGVSTTRRPRLGRPKPLIGKSFDDSVRYEQFGTTTDNPTPTWSSSESSTSAPKDTSSAEALDELWARVSAMGPSGRRALRRLAVRLDTTDVGEAAMPSSEEAGEVVLLRKLVQQLLSSNTRTRIQRKPTRGPPETPRMAAGEAARSRSSRHLFPELLDVTAARGQEAEEIALRSLLEEEVRKQMGSVRTRREATQELASELGAEQGPDEDAAFEEGLSPDGIAHDRGRINETTLNDRSNDEFWSSFSSSEEALMNCEGLILYLPLTARQTCSHPASAAVTPTDTFSYTAPSAGYYFFVFSSENEIQENLISVGFTLDRTVYNVSQRVAQCDNATSCAFPLDFFSSETVVLEVPMAPGKEGPSPGDSADTLSRHWNEEYLVISTCEPRTSLYLVCVVLVPILILCFAFQ